jgi:uncharacterized RDD family membrane protein YckC
MRRALALLSDNGIRADLAGTLPKPAAARPAVPKSDKQARRKADEQRRQQRTQDAERLQASRGEAFMPVGALEPSPRPPAPRPVRAGKDASTQASDQGQTDKAQTDKAQAESVTRVGWALRRWCARAVDLATSALLAVAILTFVLGQIEPELALGLQSWQNEPVLLAWMGVVAWLPFEALALTLTGTTPGKALFGIRVHVRDGLGIGLGAAMTRSWQVLLKGLLFGLLPFTLLAQGWGFVRFVSDGKTAWDDAAQTHLSYQSIGTNRWLAGVVVGVAAWVLLLEGVSGRLLQKLLADLAGQF